MNSCSTCKYLTVMFDQEPRATCSHTNWEPNEPSPKPAEVETPKNPKKSKWHKVEEKMPKDLCMAYMVWDNNPDPSCIKLYWNVEFTGRNFVSNNGCVLEHVTHWRYVPNPPKEYRK